MNARRSPFAGRVFPDPFPPLCASAWGDDRYGLWCEIEVGGVVQRLRWIEPGAFWMGSTEDERRRFARGAGRQGMHRLARESPRHHVLLTKGVWLADTACTKELWRVVVDDRSLGSGDEDMQSPVDQVSWDDVTKVFLPRISRLLAGAWAALPTEAEWEYACRAGSETAFHFGEDITTDQANFDGSRPAPRGRKGTSRHATVAVKTLPANAWGLYSMHGNVWEWCADAPRVYGAESVVDPDGGQITSERALRGGAWDGGAKEARSACRNRFDRHFRLVHFGFRFALRSIEPSAGGGMGGLDEAGGSR